MAFILVAQIMLTACGSSKYDFDIETSPMFRYNNLGDSANEIKEPTPLNKKMELGDNTMFTYKGATIDGMEADLIYIIDQDNTFAGGIIYYHPDDMEAAYKSLVNKCDELYGRTHFFTDSDSVTWKLDDRYVVVIKGSTNGGKLVYNVCTHSNYENN